MKHTYTIIGMHCNSCKSKVEKALNSIEGVKAEVNLDAATAEISMLQHIQTAEFQEVLSAVGNYTIKVFNANDLKLESVATPKPTPLANAVGKYYCPMFCEGDKVYDEPGSCPVCGMDLVTIFD